jgi:hypothetical protein
MVVAQSTEWWLPSLRNAKIKAAFDQPSRANRPTSGPKLNYSWRRIREANRPLCHKFLGIAFCLVGANTIATANAQQTPVIKAEAVLIAKIRCEDFRKNSDNTWTSVHNTKIGANAFPTHTFDVHGVSIGGADLATVLNRKCRG